MSKKEKSEEDCISEQDELIVKSFFTTHGYQAEKIRESKQQQRPDFRIVDKRELFFFVEVKSIIQSSLEGFKYKTLFNRIFAKTCGASEQFEAVNRVRLVPNILAIVSHDMRINFDGLKDYIRGYIDLEGCIISDFRNTDVIRKSHKSLSNIDVIMWFQGNKPSFLFIKNNIDYSSKLHQSLLAAGCLQNVM